jgi:hypothetical protein
MASRALACVCAVLAVGVAVAAGAPAPAFADGDPASDVLATQPLFLAADGGFPQSQAAQLRELLASARRAGVPIRVALIATQADLGSVTELWRQPQNYASFLGQELAQVYRGTVVVVMPNGTGVYHSPAGPPGGPVQATGVSPASAMTDAAIVTVGAIASDAGHHLPVPRAVATPRAGSALGSVDLGSWVALAAGAALIALAWAASLRARGPGARPPGLRRAWPRARLRRER